VSELSPKKKWIFPDKINNQTLPNLWSSLWPNLWSNLWLNLWLNLWPNLWSNLWLNLWLNLWSNLWPNPFVRPRPEELSGAAEDTGLAGSSTKTTWSRAGMAGGDGPDTEGFVDDGG
jgi:hypothetical protein